MISTFAGTGQRGSVGDGGPAVRAQLAEPVSVTADAAGNVYVGEEGSSRVRRIGLDGTIETVAGKAEIATPIDLSIGPDGSLFVLDTDRPSLRRVDRRGVISTVVGTGEAGILADSGHTISRDLCGRPLGFAFDPKGAVYVACSNANRVVRVEPDGSFTTVAGSSGSGYAGDGGRATNARLNGPFSIAFDSAGNLYIADSGNHRVRKVDTAGVITTFAGTGRPGSLGRRLSRVVCRPVDAGRRRSRRARQRLCPRPRCQPHPEDRPERDQ